jgi:transposase
MDQYIALDSHKHYSLAAVEGVSSRRVRHERIEHRPGAIRERLCRMRPGGAVAVEATGNWYWILDEIEAAGMRGLLVHPRKAKLMMGMINKTDKLDADGLNRLQRNGTLPTVWVPPGELRDLRELTRGRLVLTTHRTRLKNRVQSTLAKYGRTVDDVSDVFGVAGRRQVDREVEALPEQSRFVTRLLLMQLDLVEAQVKEIEKRLEGLVRTTAEMEWLDSLPGVGTILAATIALETGEIARFASAERYASYAGTTPRVHASGDKVRYGRLRPDVNRYLKWGFLEAANSVALNHGRWPGRHVSVKYEEVRRRRGHPKAVGAVARHLAEAAFHVLSRREDYRDPAMAGRGQARET